MAGGGQNFEFGAAIQQVVVVFGGDKPLSAEFAGEVLGVGKLPPRKVGVPQVTHLSAGHERIKSRQGLFQRGVRVGAVVEIQVNVLGSQAAQ